MKRKTLVSAVEWLFVLLLLWLAYRANVNPVGSPTPEQAHRLSESGYHYGPSDIARKVIVPFDNNHVVFLGTYKNWFSADSVHKERGGWVPGSGVAGVPIDRDQPVSYSWEGNSNGDSVMTYKFYGYVSGERIAAVTLSMKEKDSGRTTTMREEIGSDRMFLFLWEAKDGSREWQSLRGLGPGGEVIYEHNFND